MKPKKPNSFKPWKCVILAIDPGRVSGAAVYVKGKLLVSMSDYHQVTRGPSRYKKSEFCRMAYEAAEKHNIPLIVVIESHVIHGRWTAKAMAGAGESVGVWKYFIKQLPKLKWTPKVLRLPLDEWRLSVYGHCRAREHFSYDKKSRILSKDSRSYFKELACHTAKVDDDNEAEAILIGRCAARWWMVGEQPGVETI